MCFTGGGLTVALATTHVPLRGVAKALRAAQIERTAWHLDVLLRRIFRVARPRILVCALNPHAGEGGLVGDEEERIVAPAIRRLRRSLGAGVLGPIPGDAAFRLALGRPQTAVVALYHDQATLPVKLACFNLSANVTLGLPYLRTSVDHGVAYDKAGRGRADAGGMIAAISLAAKHGERARRIRWTTGPK
jgi:4-hydroxythreonine-4-phosphate dehydrogenase